MVRTPSFDKNGIKKGAWSPEEDKKLEAYITRYGHWNWRELPKFAGLKRCGKSCRLRWMNYLRPNVRRGNYTKLEEDLIVELHEKHGNKWAMIAGRLPGRTDNEIKNHWHTHLKKRCWSSTSSSAEKIHVSSSAADKAATSDSDRSTQRQASSGQGTCSSNQTMVADEECFRHIQILESCPFSPAAPQSSSSTAAAAVSSSSSKNNNTTTGVSGIIFQDTMSTDCFLPAPPGLFISLQDDLFEPATTRHTTNSSSSTNGEVMGGELAVTGSVTTDDIYGGLLEGDDDFWTKPYTVEEMIMMSSYDVFHDYSTADQLLLSPPYMPHYDQILTDLFSPHILQSLT